MKRYKTLIIVAAAAGALAVLALPSTASAWGLSVRFGHSDSGATYCPPPYWDYYRNTYVVPPCERAPGYYGYGYSTPRYYSGHGHHRWGEWSWRNHERHERHGWAERHRHHRGHHGDRD